MNLYTLVNGISVQEKQPSPAPVKEYDVIVAGLGTAGCYAALTAARRGLRVLGIERETYVGGTGTGGSVFCYYYGTTGGMYEEIDAKVKAFCSANNVYGPEAFKYLVEKECLNGTVDIAYGAAVVGVYRKGHTVGGVRFRDDTGMHDAVAPYVIDATANGDVAAMAGCAFQSGRASDGEPQPFSSAPRFLRRKADGSVTITWSNFDAGYTDPLDPDDFSDSIAHANALHLPASFNEGNALVFVSPIIGLRESRLIVGERTVRFSDLIHGNVEKDPVLFVYSNFDSHSKDWAFEGDMIKDWMLAGSLWGRTVYIPIPLDSFLPKGWKGILVACRAMAVDHEMATAVRMRKEMQRAGEIAATAISLSLKEHIDVRQVPHATLIAELKKTGCYDPAAQYKPNEWPRDGKTIYEALATNKPGEAVWGAYLLGNEMKRELRQWLTDGDEHRRRNSALALGLLGDRAALPVLREIVSSRDDYQPETGRSNNQKRIYGALHLLGKFADADSVADIAALLKERAEVFQDCSHALMALLTIGRKKKEVRAAVADTVTKVLSDASFQHTLVMKVSSSGEGTPPVSEDMTQYMRIIAAKELDSWGTAHSLSCVIGSIPLTHRNRRLLA